MEIPQNVKINVLAVLLSNGRDKGVRLDTFCETFQKIMKEQLHYQALGYRSLMEFFQAMPDVVRLKYRQREEAWEAYGIPKPNTFSPSERGHLSQFQKQTVTQSPVLQMQSGVKRPGMKHSSIESM